MAIFIFVHGGLHGGSCWSKVVHEIESIGHLALAPDLPGVGANPMPPEDVSLEVLGSFIAGLARKQTEKVVLVGHSLGGITISDAAERAPEAVAGLIFVSALLLPDGSSASSLLNLEKLNPGTSLSNDGALLIVNDPEYARTRYYSGCDEDDIHDAMSKLLPQPTRPIRDRLALSAERFGQIPRAYIECLYDNAVPLHIQRSFQVALPCDPVFSMETGHSPFIQSPKTFVARLIEAAATFNN